MKKYWRHLLLGIGSLLLLTACLKKDFNINSENIKGNYECNYEDCKGYKLSLYKNGKGKLVNRNEKVCDIEYSLGDSDMLGLGFSCNDGKYLKIVNPNRSSTSNEMNIRIPIGVYREKERVRMYFCVMIGDSPRNCFGRDLVSSR